MKKRPFTLVLLAPLALTCASIQTAKAQANDMFPTKAAAEQRAKQSPCIQVHNPRDRDTSFC